jgi:hypothetical protein
MGIASGLVKDFDVMCDVLCRLLHLSDWAWRNEKYLSGNCLKPNTRATYERLKRANVVPLTLEELELLIEEARKTKARPLYFKNRFYLPPLEENSEHIAVLSLDSNLAPSQRCISFRVEMYSFRDASGGDAMRAVGFRFELGKPRSKHGYYHVQFTTEKNAKEGRRPLPDCPLWMPTSEPCLIVPARSPVSLVFCIMVSYYGNISKINSLISNLNIEDRHKEVLQYLATSS